MLANIIGCSKKVSFQLFPKFSWSATARKSSGSPFHAEGLAYENACSANFVRSRGSV